MAVITFDIDCDKVKELTLDMSNEELFDLIVYIDLVAACDEDFTRKVYEWYSDQIDGFDD